MRIIPSKNDLQWISFAQIGPEPPPTEGTPPPTDDVNKEQEKQQTQFSIPLEKLDAVKKRMEKLTRVAEKLGIPPMVMDVVGTEDKKYTDEDGKEYYVKNVVIRILGDPPVLNGWRLVARILHGEEGNIIKAVPGQAVPLEYRESAPKCDHCQKSRARRDTFVVTNGQEWKQVGTNCLADFLGHQDPRAYVSLAEAYANLASELESWEGEGGGMRTERSGLGATEYLAAVSAVRRARGWMSRTKVKEKQAAGDYGAMATADLAWGYMTNPNARKDMKDVEVTDDDVKGAEAALEWARELRKKDDLSDYLWNLAVAASSPVVYERTKGILASALVAHENATRVVEEGTSVGEGWLGREGMPVTVKGKLKEVKPVSTQRGRSFLHSLEDMNGNLVKWFSDSEDMAQKAGTDVMISGVVQKHGEFRGQRETMLIGVRNLDETEYQAAMDAQAKAEEERAKGKVEPLVFNVGDKLFRRVRVVDKKYIEGDYGTSILHLMIDEQTGQNYKWFSSAEDLEVGRSYNMECTVKGEDEFKGKKSTQVTRCKLYTDEEFAAGGKVEKWKGTIKPKEKKRLETEIKQIDERIWKIDSEANTIGSKGGLWGTSSLDKAFIQETIERAKRIGGEDLKSIPRFQSLLDNPELEALRTEKANLLKRREEAHSVLQKDEDALKLWYEQRQDKIHGKKPTSSAGTWVMNSCKFAQQGKLRQGTPVILPDGRLARVWSQYGDDVDFTPFGTRKIQRTKRDQLDVATPELLGWEPGDKGVVDGMGTQLFTFVSANPDGMTISVKAEDGRSMNPNIASFQLKSQAQKQ